MLHVFCTAILNIVIFLCAVMLAITVHMLAMYCASSINNVLKIKQHISVRMLEKLKPRFVLLTFHVQGSLQL